MILHGGWGYETYPFDRQIAALGDRYRILIAGRTGYGASGRIDMLPTDFHRRAAVETLALLAALGSERAVLWGHSDGAVIALLAGLLAPERIGAIVAEATHFLRRKPASRRFFETVAHAPERLGERFVDAFEREHGPDWRRVIAMNGDVWLRLADTAGSSSADLYDGSLGSLRVPTLLVHGARDPRTEPGELDRLRSALCRPGPSGPDARMIVFKHAGHSPHNSRETADRVTHTVARFLAASSPEGTL